MDIEREYDNDFRKNSHISQNNGRVYSNSEMAFDMNYQQNQSAAFNNNQNKYAYSYGYDDANDPQVPSFGAQYDESKYNSDYYGVGGVMDSDLKAEFQAAEDNILGGRDTSISLEKH